MSLQELKVTMKKSGKYQSWYKLLLRTLHTKTNRNTYIKYFDLHIRDFDNLSFIIQKHKITFYLVYILNY